MAPKNMPKDNFVNGLGVLNRFVTAKKLEMTVVAQIWCHLQPNS